MNNRWIVKHDGEIVYQPQTIDAKILDISDEALAKISMWVNSESEVVSNLKLEIEELKHRLKLANIIIDELIEVAEVHLDDTFEKINELNKLQGEK